MTEQEINIAIAESLGYDTDVCLCGERFSSHSYYSNHHPNNGILDYAHDLNACVEFEKSFDIACVDEQSKYLDYLYCTIGWDGANGAIDAKHRCYYGSVRATAIQRCEAYLRVKGLWKEETK